MSAFFVGHDHIDALIAAAIAAETYFETPDGGYVGAKQVSDERWSEIGRLLIAENRASLAARYGGNSEMLEGTSDPYTYRDPFLDLPTSRHAQMAAIRLADCFDYQACEHDGWRSSWAHGFVTTVITDAAKKLSRAWADGDQGKRMKLWAFTRKANP